MRGAATLATMDDSPIPLRRWAALPHNHVRRHATHGANTIVPYGAFPILCIKWQKGDIGYYISRPLWSSPVYGLPMYAVLTFYYRLDLHLSTRYGMGKGKRETRRLCHRYARR